MKKIPFLLILMLSARAPRDQPKSESPSRLSPVPSPKLNPKDLTTPSTPQSQMMGASSSASAATPLTVKHGAVESGSTLVSVDGSPNLSPQAPNERATSFEGGFNAFGMVQASFNYKSERKDSGQPPTPPFLPSASPSSVSGSILEDQELKGKLKAQDMTMNSQDRELKKQEKELKRQAETVKTHGYSIKGLRDRANLAEEQLARMPQEIEEKLTNLSKTEIEKVQENFSSRLVAQDQKISRVSTSLAEQGKNSQNQFRELEKKMNQQISQQDRDIKSLIKSKNEELAKLQEQITQLQADYAEQKIQNETHKKDLSQLVAKNHEMFLATPKVSIPTIMASYVLLGFCYMSYLYSGALFAFLFDLTSRYQDIYEFFFI